MPGWLSILIPAAAALAGVALTQAWTSRTEERRWQREDRQKVYETRRTAAGQYLSAVNDAIDATRRLVAVRKHSRAYAPCLSDFDAKWHEAYERGLALGLILPARARSALDAQVAAAFAWRDRAVMVGNANDPPRNEALRDELETWMHPELPGER